jgi:hypothetical protein
MHQMVNAKVVSQYHATLELEATRAIAGLIREPARYEHWFELYSAGIVFRLAFGKRLVTGEEDVLKRIVDVVHNLERVASPGACKSPCHNHSLKPCLLACDDITRDRS